MHVAEWAECHAAVCSQVRAAAYKALHNYPLSLMEELSALPSLALFTAPLLHTGAHTAPALQGPEAASTAGALPESARGWEDNAAARSTLLQLALRAVHFEHENRRRFFAVASAGAAGAGSASAAAGGAGAASSVADEREERALRHRLLSVLPKSLSQLVGGGRGGKGGGRGPAVMPLPAAAGAALLTTGLQDSSGKTLGRWAMPL